jgi:hypothetical protein
MYPYPANSTFQRVGESFSYESPPPLTNPYDMYDGSMYLGQPSQLPSTTGNVTRELGSSPQRSIGSLRHPAAASHLSTPSNQVANLSPWSPTSGANSHIRPYRVYKTFQHRRPRRLDTSNVMQGGEVVQDPIDPELSRYQPQSTSRPSETPAQVSAFLPRHSHQASQATDGLGYSYFLHARPPPENNYATGEYSNLDIQIVHRS